MDASSLGTLLACGLAVFAAAVIALELAPRARAARCRRRRSRLHLVMGGGDSRSRTLRRSSPTRGPMPASPPSSWDPVPVVQWQPPREHEPEPSPAA